MSRWVLMMMLGALLAVGPLTAPTGATEPLKHAGQIAAVDPSAQTIRVEVMGPWRGPDTIPTSYDIVVPRDAAITLVARADVGAEGWRGGFVAEPLTLRDLTAGDFAVVTLRREGSHLVATQVEVVRPDASGS